jgi:hypothetical protein
VKLTTRHRVHCTTAGSEKRSEQGVPRRPLSSIPPEILAPVRRQRRVDGGAGDRPVAEPACPGVAARAKAPIVMTPVRHQAIQEVFLGRPDALQADRP